MSCTELHFLDYKFLYARYVGLIRSDWKSSPLLFITIASHILFQKSYTSNEESLDSTVGIATAYGLGERKAEFESR
jgi:hypothetical protein